MTDLAHPPETLEGWYALHQVLRAHPPSDTGAGTAYAEISRGLAESVARLNGGAGSGWSAVCELLTGASEFLVMHFRPTFDDLGAVRAQMRGDPAFAGLHEAFSMVSVTEAGLYHISAELARAASERGGRVGDDAYRRDLDRRREAERANEHVQRRLYPPLPAEMPYVCFYPMSKRRDAVQNWYVLSLEARSRLMRAHGETGRRYAGKVQQIITGAIGLSEWEWGVTLFAKDPLDFKKLVTDMRFDEVSAKYAEFGEFHVGRIVTAAGKS